MSIEDLSVTIKPKSDQLNADDLISGPRTVFIEGVRLGSTEDQPVILDLGEGLQPYKPCKSMRRLLVFCWGKNGKYWKGRNMTIFNDPSVTWAGQAIGGIRISHLSNLDKPVSVALTTTRGKRKPYTVEPLVLPAYDSALFQENIAAWTKAIEGGKITALDLTLKITKLKTLSKEQHKTIMALAPQQSDL